MLNLHNLNEPDDLYSFIDKFDPFKQTWIVADLKSKEELQRKWLKKFTILPETAILRASELWKKIFIQEDLGYRIVSSEFIQALLQEWLGQKKIAWAQTPQSSLLLYNYIQLFLPLQETSTSHSHEALMLWFDKNPKAFVRWGAWYLLSREAWIFLKEKKVIVQNWIPNFLSAHADQIHWKYELFFDLGGNLSLPEADLMESLSKSQEVHAFCPGDKWMARFKESLWPYAFLQKKSLDNHGKNFFIEEIVSQDKIDLSQFYFKGRDHYARFSTAVSEVKDTLAELRELLNQGMQPHEIGILAPNIEDYWKILKSYLAKEGIPVNKPEVVNLASYARIQKWLSRLRIELNIFQTSDLEGDLYSDSPRSFLNFETFQKVYANIYEPEDLSRLESIKRLYNQKIGAQHIFNRDEFFAWSLKFWSNYEDTKWIESVFQQLLQECPARTELSVSSWLFYVEGLCGKKEVIVKEAHPQGIHCENIDSAKYMNLKEVFILGMSEKNLRQSRHMSVSIEDVLSLAQDLGIYLGFPEGSVIEYDLTWLLKSPALGKANLKFSETDLLGAREAPSLFWLLGAYPKLKEELKKSQIPKSSYWDLLQMQSVEAIYEVLSIPKEKYEERELVLKSDLGLVEREKVLPRENPSFSPTQFENYNQCPFIFCAEKIFKLRDEPEVDIDLDALSRGRLLHKIFEILCEEPRNFDWTEEQITNLIDEAAINLKLIHADQNIWSQKKQKYIDTMRNFIGLEKEYRNKFPIIKTLAREQKIQAAWSIKENDFVSREVGGDYLFNGVIDRVDGCQTHDGDSEIGEDEEKLRQRFEGAQVNFEYDVLDYKSTSSGSLSHWKSWEKQDKWQLLLYSYCIEKGLSELEKGTVLSACFYSAKDLQRNKGFFQPEGEGTHYPESTRFNKIEKKEKEQAYQNMRGRIQTFIEGLQLGNFPAQPKDFNSCQDCHWRNLCRAPHLN